VVIEMLSFYYYPVGNEKFNIYME